jgi:hypothetical protein
MLARPYGQEGDAAILARPARPRAQQRRLPGAGSRGDNRDLLAGGPVLGGYQIVPEDQPGLCPARRAA